MVRKKSGIKGMKLIAIKKECYAIAQVENTQELKKKYQSLCQNRDLRKRSSWEYLLKRIRADGSWMGVKISEVEKIEAPKTPSNHLVFRPEMVDWYKAAENDD